MAVAACTVALNIIYEGLFLIVLTMMMKKYLLLRNILNSRPECKNHTLILTKMAKIDTLFMTKMAEKLYPLGPHIPTVHIAHIRQYPPRWAWW